MLEPEPLSHSLALNYVEQILQNLSCFGELCQAQPTSIAVQLSHLPRITFHNLPAICLLLPDFREQPRWLTVPSLLESAKREHTPVNVYPKDIFCVKNESKMHVGDKELKSVTQINLPLCHTIFLPSMKLSYRPDLSNGSLQYSFSCICMDFYTNIHMCTHIHNKKSIWLSLIADRYQKRNKIK